MSAQRSKSLLRGNFCRYCGIEGAGNYPCERDCVEGLTAEIETARRLLASHQPKALQEYQIATAGPHLTDKAGTGVVLL